MTVRRAPARAGRLGREQWHPVAVCAVAFVMYFGVTLVRYLTYHAPAYDLGFFEQVTERTAAGHPFATSFIPYNFLGQHWEPVLAVPAVCDRIIASPVWLLLLQAAALALAPAAAWLLARRWLGGRLVPVVVAVITALSPLIARGAVFDFHTESLTAALTLVALERSAAGSRAGFVLPLLALALVKEDALLVAAGAGWITWRADGRRLGLAVAAVGVAGFLVLVGAVMPALREGHPSDLVERYAYLGGPGVAGVLRGAITNPVLMVRHLLSPDPLRGAVLAVGPLALLPLLSGLALLGALAPLLIALLSADPAQATLGYHYGLEAFPLLLACALLGWRRLELRLSVARRPRARGVLGGLAIAATLVGYIVASPLPGGMRFTADNLSGLERRAAVERVLQAIPGDADVSASTGLVPHLANRANIFEFPAGPGSRFVVIDDVAGVSVPSASAGFDSARRRLPEYGYHVVMAEAGVTLWAR